jgi:uncharacterized protein (TIGR03086 family)
MTSTLPDSPIHAIDFFRRASQGADDRIRAIQTDQWGSSTPCSEWDVRALVNHLVYEDMRAPLVLEGKTADEIGDQFEGELVGDDPLDAWERARQGVIDAASETPMDRTVHLFFGDVPAASYLNQLAQGHLIHSWDIARAIGADERLDEELVSWTYTAMKPQEEMLGQSGVFSSAIEPASGADEQTKLLNLTGRRP